MDERVKKFRELMDGPSELKALQGELEMHLRSYGDAESFPNTLILKDESYIEKIFEKLDEDEEPNKSEIPTGLAADCISRQAVLELIADFSLSMGQVVKAIYALPPVNQQKSSRNMEEIEEIINCDADAETKCKMISNILTAEPHYFEEPQESEEENAGY